ncbi:hypothetical protein Agub_g20 [Astrephomene gubernaculifera]|uniref:Transmembrane protein 209 n=1 Tax=Astrephomene gubernaculifera TaxID=47775 RepID=A0AAD3DE29_9CHLO|nr:hypothetical protein Agub_g20 [Astrephomene gubernaculifera]
MPSRWNVGDPAAGTVVAPVTRTRTALRILLRDAAFGALSVLLWNWRSAVLVLLPATWARSAVHLAVWVLPLVFLVRVLETVTRWYNSRHAARTQDSVTGIKRKLYGLPPPAPRQEPLRQRRPFSLNPPRVEAVAASSAPQLTPITPPQRYAAPSPGVGTPYSSASGASNLGGGLLAATPADDRTLARTPLSEQYRRSPQPHGYSPGGAVVASPEQLSYYFDNLGGAGTAGVAASPQQPDAMAGMYGYTGAASPAYAVAAEQDQGTPGALPVGVSAPYYRMTWMPKKAAAVAAADTPTLTPSAPEEVEDFIVSVLGARQDWLEVWTERLREWLAGKVLQPLVAAAASAHEPVNTLLHQFNHATRLPPLPDILTDSRTAGAGDIDGVLRSLQTTLTQHVQAQPMAPTTAKAQELLAAVNRYTDLLAVVRGKRPADILPPSNSGYVWTRLQQLAESSCLKDFTWNGGSAYGGRPWSADQLPTDSALVLYLFVAYLDAPGWQFTAPPNSQAEGTMQPLYLGTLPAGTRSAGACSAILTYRPERHGRDMDALLALQLQTASPLFCYLAAGRLMVLANNQYVAVFHAILFFLQYHKVRYGGAIGRQKMEDPDLALDAVVQPPSVGAQVSLGRKKGPLGWFA